jgi:hypothetical protein
MRFKILMAATIKMRAFWNFAQCSLVLDRRFKGAYCLSHQENHRTEDGGRKSL